MENNTNKKNQGIYTIIGAIIIWTICGLLIYGIYYFTTSAPDTMNNFCKSLGFKKATDFKDLGFCADGRSKTYFIECDKKKIYNVISEETCKDYNKWGECYFKKWDDYKITNGDCK